MNYKKKKFISLTLAVMLVLLTGFSDKSSSANKISKTHAVNKEVRSIIKAPAAITSEPAVNPTGEPVPSEEASSSPDKKSTRVPDYIIEKLSDFSFTDYDDYTLFEITVDNTDDLIKSISSAYSYSNEERRFVINVSDGVYDISSEIKFGSYTDLNLYENAVLDCEEISTDYAVRIKGSHVSIDGGTIKGKGIIANNVTDISITNTIIDSPDTSGIIFKGKNGDCVIENNTIKNAEENGIWLCTANITGDLDNNTITGAGEISLYLYKAKLHGNISGNHISKSKGSGIYAGYSSIDGDISNNVLSKVKSKGIGIYHASHAGNITGNRLTDMGGAHNGFNGDVAIMVNADEGPSKKGKKTYVKSITNNYIKGVTYSGIALYSGPSGKKDKKFNQDKAYVKNNISGNTIINAGTYQHSKGWKKEIKKGGKIGVQAGIYADVHSRVYGKIVNNNITKTNQHGIYVRMGARVKSIEKNTVSLVKEDGIGVYFAKVNKVISNKVKGAKRVGIYAREKAKINVISKNKVSKCARKVVVHDKAKVKSVKS